MNTNPDETKIALWLDDELEGAELAEMEAWAAGNPEQLAAREEIRAYRQTMADNLPASEEPPFPDFFVSRVRQGIREREDAERPVEAAVKTSFWKSWFMPAAACAGMVFAFTVGKQSREPGQPLAVVPQLSPVVYTPEEGVDAEWFASNAADANVILLQGVDAIPDSTDFSETVYVPTARESDRTATRDSSVPGNSANQ